MPDIVEAERPPPARVVVSLIIRVVVVFPPSAVLLGKTWGTEVEIKFSVLDRPQFSYMKCFQRLPSMLVARTFLVDEDIRYTYKPGCRDSVRLGRSRQNQKF